MMWRNSYSAYGAIAKLIHWLIFILVLIMLMIGFLMGSISDKAFRGEIIQIHKMTGLFILCLMILRAIWASFNPKPVLPLGTPRWEILAERTVHFLLYLVLIAMPIVGWVSSVAAGHPPKLFNLTFNLPVPKNEILSDIGFQAHGLIAFMIIFLVSIHVIAAFYHYFVKKDNILQRML